jgi:hypothetical protein
VLLVRAHPDAEPATVVRLQSLLCQSGMGTKPAEA